MAIFARHTSPVAEDMFRRAESRPHKHDINSEQLARQVRAQVEVLKHRLYLLSLHHRATILAEIFAMAKWWMDPCNPHYDTFLGRVYCAYLYEHPKQPLLSDKEIWDYEKNLARSLRKFAYILERCGLTEQQFYDMFFREVDWNQSRPPCAKEPEVDPKNMAQESIVDMHSHIVG